VHARTHVDYQTAGGSVDHVLGLARLDGWLAVGATTAVLASHLSWHAALHELARGDCAAALRRYRSGIAPTAADSRGGIDAAGTLRWRLALRGQVVAPDDALLVLTAPVAAKPPFAFAAVHAGLVFAAAVGDAAAIAAVADRVRRTRDRRTPTSTRPCSTRCSPLSRLGTPSVRPSWVRCRRAS